jgi:hypothetical protein
VFELPCGGVELGGSEASGELEDEPLGYGDAGEVDHGALLRSVVASTGSAVKWSEPTTAAA